MSLRPKKPQTSTPTEGAAAGRVDVATRLFRNELFVPQEKPSAAPPKVATLGHVGDFFTGLGGGENKKALYITGLAYGANNCYDKAVEEAIEMATKYDIDYILWEGHPICQQFPLEYPLPVEDTTTVKNKTSSDSDKLWKLEHDSTSFPRCSAAGVVDDLHKALDEKGRHPDFVFFRRQSMKSLADFDPTVPDAKPIVEPHVFDVPGVERYDPDQPWNRSMFRVVTGYDWIRSRTIQSTEFGLDLESIESGKVLQVTCRGDRCDAIQYAHEKLNVKHVYQLCLGAEVQDLAKFSEPRLLDGKYVQYNEIMGVKQTESVPPLTRCDREPVHLMQNLCMAVVALHPFHEMFNAYNESNKLSEPMGVNSKPSMLMTPSEEATKKTLEVAVNDLNQKYETCYSKLREIELLLRRNGENVEMTGRFLDLHRPGYRAQLELRTDPRYQTQVYECIGDEDAPTVYRRIVPCMFVPRFYNDIEIKTRTKINPTELQDNDLQAERFDPRTDMRDDITEPNP